ncbi:delta 8-sphingoloid desaturase protein [Mycena floridula]|nr:delta 8-sphingoloid desaturase protein [Mycena floridula]
MSALSSSEVTDRILKGQNIIIYDGQVLVIPTGWLEAHPGGSLAILHFVGKDATDEIDAYHDKQTTDLIRRYSIGTLEKAWEPLLPPISVGWIRKNNQWYKEAASLQSQSSPEILLVGKDTLAPQLSSGPTLASLTPPVSQLSPEVQARHSAAYKRLHQRVIEAGLYDTPYLTGYGPEVLRYVLLGSLSAFAYRNNWFITSALFLGLMWHQLMFFVHDLAHRGVTHNWTIDRLVSIFIADFIGGLSVGWWVDTHSVHHLVTNQLSHDPDIEHLPFFAISPSFFSNIYSTYYKRVLSFDAFSRFFISMQHKLFYIVLSLGRLNLYFRSYTYLFSKAFDTRRARGARWAWPLEIAGIMCFWIWFSAVLRGCGTWQKALLYILVSHAATSPLHVQLVLSHFSMSTEDLGPYESFPHRQLRTTSDVICPPYMAFIHGGLHLQITHHFFPRLPRHNLKKGSELVKQFAKEEGLRYAEFGFVRGNQDVLGVLRSVAQQVQLMKDVVQVEVRQAVEKKISA